METSIDLFRTEKRGRDRRVNFSYADFYLNKVSLRGEEMFDNTSKPLSKRISISCVVVMEGYVNSELI